VTERAGERPISPLLRQPYWRHKPVILSVVQVEPRWYYFEHQAEVSNRTQHKR